MPSPNPLAPPPPDSRQGGGSGLRLHDLVLRQAASTPGALAVKDHEETLSYRELVRRAEAVARVLRTEGVGPDVPVGVCAGRSVRLVVALLGVLLADGAYVALDPEYPAERLAHMAGATGMPLVLADEASGAKAQQALGTDPHPPSPHPAPPHPEPTHAAPPPEPGLRLLRAPAHAPPPVHAPPPAPGHPAHPHRAPTGDQDLAYVLFTSGSTGRPKGVAVPHRGIVANLEEMQRRYGLRPDDSVLHKAPYSFDTSLWEIFWPLSAGARIVMAAPGAHGDVVHLAELIRREALTTVQTVPSLLALLVEGDLLAGAASLRRVLCIGEALQSTTANRFREVSRAELHNLYGPTEASVGVTHWPCRAVEPPGTVPLGFPMAGVTAHVLDASGDPAPRGEPGELHLGGAFLARGYLGQPGLTAAQFVPDHVSGAVGARLYRTGDLVRRHPAGHLEFLGRTDDQVKVDGLRVEPGEIEARLLAHPAVTRAVVIVREDMGRSPRLVAYVTCAAGRETPDLAAHLAQSLPAHMVPAFLVRLPSLPLTPNGKVDRAALPRPERARRPRTGGTDAARATG